MKHEAAPLFKGHFLGRDFARIDLFKKGAGGGWPAQEQSLGAASQIARHLRIEGQDFLRNLRVLEGLQRRQRGDAKGYRLAVVKQTQQRRDAIRLANLAEDFNQAEPISLRRL